MIGDDGTEGTVHGNGRARIGISRSRTGNTGIGRGETVSGGTGCDRTIDIGRGYDIEVG